MKSFKLALVFTGHMIDLPNRKSPRFPSIMEKAARSIIRRRVAYAKRAERGGVIGIASGARGGDILFLEACHGAGLATHIVLPFAVDDFLESSVRGTAKGDWEQRFLGLWKSQPKERRDVLNCPVDQNPYDYCNRHMMVLAQNYAPKLRLLALWDGVDQEIKPGGTASFVAMVKQARGKFSRVDTTALLSNL